MANDLVIVYNILPELMVAMHDAAADVVERTTKEIGAETESNAPVETGFMQSSTYTVTKSGSTYGQDIVDGKPGSYLLPEVEKPSDDQTGIIAVGANYGAFVNYGTARMGAQPFFDQAVESGRSFFTEWMSDLESDIRKKVSVP
jgi:HK97 gp10 family phage protein